EATRGELRRLEELLFANKEVVPSDTTAMADRSFASERAFRRIRWGLDRNPPSGRDSRSFLVWSGRQDSTAHRGFAGRGPHLRSGRQMLTRLAGAVLSERSLSIGRSGPAFDADRPPASSDRRPLPGPHRQ